MNDTPATLRLSILVVDDEDAVRELLRWMLEEAGHRVYEACDGSDALAFLARHGTIDIVLSDVNMPVMDGLEFSRELGLAFPGLPLLLISGRPLPVGPRPFLPKPFRWDALAGAISRLAGPTGHADHRA